MRNMPGRSLANFNIKTVHRYDLRDEDNSFYRDDANGPLILFGDAEWIVKSRQGVINELLLTIKDLEDLLAFTAETEYQKGYTSGYSGGFTKGVSAPEDDPFWGGGW